MLCHIYGSSWNVMWSERYVYGNVIIKKPEMSWNNLIQTMEA